MGIERLIEQCRQGDKEALGKLYKAYAQRMRSICQRYVSDPQSVDDVLHDAFIVIFTSLERLKDETKAEAWMAGIVRNIAIKYGKRLKAVKIISQEEVTEEVLNATAENESAVGLWDDRIYDNLVLRFGNIESATMDQKYYLYDCYPLQFSDSESVKANRDRNEIHWRTFIQYLDTKGKLIL